MGEPIVTPEPDSGADIDPADSTEPKQERRIVQLTYGEQTVTVDAPDDLETVANLAAYFWLLTSPPQKVTLGFTAGSTLITERSETYHEGSEQEGCP
jgi:hypothetical protein